MGYEAPKDYVEVAERILEFREKYPEGSLQGDAEFIDTGKVCGWKFVARAYRTADDQRPGVGTAWEPVPGKTPYTRDSELQNAETSAWGRALIAVGAADAKRGIASAQEVRNRSYVQRDFAGDGPAIPQQRPAQASPNRSASEKQIGFLKGIANKTAGVTDAGAFLDWLTDKTGRTITDTSELSAKDASDIIERSKQ